MYAFGTMGLMLLDMDMYGWFEYDVCGNERRWEVSVSGSVFT